MFSSVMKVLVAGVRSCQQWTQVYVAVFSQSRVTYTAASTDDKC